MFEISVDKAETPAFMNAMLFVCFFNHFYFTICVFLAVLGFVAARGASSGPRQGLLSSCSARVPHRSQEYRL